MEAQALTVSTLTKILKKKFESDPYLQNVFVKGEISNFKRHSSGHMYFTLKDESSKITCVMFAGVNRSLKFTPEDGLKVFLRGEVTIYETSGQYQIVTKEMTPDGLGVLAVRFEQLKKKLEGEGLFSPDRKKPIPQYPTRIGVVTSITGAAIRDILITIERRYRIAEVLVFPAIVQGEQAAPSIVASIEKAQEFDLDVLIVGRGGGSIEELWAFNEEVVARSIAQSKIPIISAVGHETDSTIADFVADYRAATPTAAAEIAVPSLDEINNRVINYHAAIHRSVRVKYQKMELQFQHAMKVLQYASPMKKIGEYSMWVDQKKDILVRRIVSAFDKVKTQIGIFDIRIQTKKPAVQFQQYQEKQMNLFTSLNQSMQRRLEKERQQFGHQLQQLEILSPMQSLKRGYAFVRMKDKVVTSVEQVQPKDQIDVVITDGKLTCVILDAKKENRHDKN